MDFLYLHFSFSAISEHSWFVSLAFLEIPFPTENIPPRLEQIGAKITLLAQIRLQYVNRNTPAQAQWQCWKNLTTEIHQHKYIGIVPKTEIPPKQKHCNWQRWNNFLWKYITFPCPLFRFVTGTDFVSSMGPPDQFPGLKGDKANGCMKDKANHARQVNFCLSFFVTFVSRR